MHYIFTMENKYLSLFLKYIRRHSFLLLVFLFTFLWFFMLTYNFNYYWEDGLFFGVSLDVVKNPEAHSVMVLSMRFLKIMTTPEHYYGVSYLGRPLNDFYSEVFGLLGYNVFTFRAVRASLVGILFIFIFLFMKKFEKEESVVSDNNVSGNKQFMNSKNLICLLSLTYFLMIPELWMLTTYLVDSLILVIIFEVVALYLFFFYYNDDTITNRAVLGIIFVGIIFFTNIAILARHLGRINFLLFFLFLLMTDRKKIVTWRYGSLIIALFLLSFPVLGILDGNTVEDVLGISENTGKSGISGTASLIITFFKTVHLSFLPHGFFLVVLLFFSLVAHAYGYLKSKSISTVEDKHLLFFLNLSLFSLIWFSLMVFSFYIARGLILEATFVRREFMIFLIPQTIFMISYAQYVYKAYFPSKKVFQYMIYIFIILAIVHNAGRLNDWRGGWGAYFLGYDTVRQYVDDNAENSLLIIPHWHGSPIYFFSTNQHAMVADITNTSLLRQYALNYTDVFITSQYSMSFNESFVVNIANMTIKDNSPYGFLKRIMGRYYQPMYVYKVEA